jgi:hypothetical protein
MEAFMEEAHQSGKRVLVIVDEAQNLSNATLEELRMLSNYQVAGQALIQIVLVGQPEFRRRLAKDPALEQVRQRVIAAYHLLPMADWDETREYIHHRLRLVGWDQDPAFTDGAIQAIHDFCGGMPRRLNQLCSRLLLYGYLEELHQIDEATVKQVISEFTDERNADAGIATDPSAGRLSAAAAPRVSEVEADAEDAPMTATEAAPSISAAPVAGMDRIRSRLLMYGFLKQMRDIDPSLVDMVADALAGNDGGFSAPAAGCGVDAYCAQMMMYGFLRELREEDAADLPMLLERVRSDAPAPAAMPGGTRNDLQDRMDALESTARHQERMLEKTLKALDELLAEGKDD